MSRRAALLALGLAVAGLAAEPPYKRSLEAYTVPAVTLINQDGRRVALKPLLEGGGPVVVDFIFGTCTTICPVLSAGFANLQAKLGEDSARVRLVSISIDPENDDPKVLRDYLRRYRAKPGWEFLTGRREDADAVMRAFNAYIPNKMSHQPLTFIRAQDGRWIRIHGLLSSTEFLAECRKAGLL